MKETLEIRDGYQLQKQKIEERVCHCLLKDGKIVFVMWGRLSPIDIRCVIDQTEAFVGATEETG